VLGKYPVWWVRTWMILIKVYDNMNIKILIMLILNMILNFTFVCNPKQNWNWRFFIKVETCPTLVKNQKP
jgi:hypothetical protein